MSHVVSECNNIKAKFFPLIKKNWILLLIILVSIILKVIKITEPFSISWDIAFQGFIAQNHYFHGLINNHFSNVIGYNDFGNIYHLKHPPLVQIFIYLSYLIFGICEVSVRIVPILFSTLSLILLYLIVQKVWKNKNLSYLTVFFFAIVPMSSWFGKVANFEVFVLFFTLLTIYSYLRFKKYKSWIFVIFILAVCAGCLSDWPYYFVIPGLLLFSILTKQKIKLAIIGFSVSFVCGLLLFLNMYILNGGITFLLKTAVHRNGSHILLNFETYKRYWQWASSYYTISFLILLIVGIILFKKIFTNKQEKYFIGLLICQPLVYLLLFPQAAYIHPWCIYFFLPVFCVIVAQVILFLKKFNKLKYLVLIALLIFTIESGFVLKKIYSSQVSPSAFSIANYLNQNLDGDDSVYLVQVLGPEFYLKSPMTCSMTDPGDIECVKQAKPKFIVINSNLGGDVAWDKLLFLEEIKELGYEQLGDTIIYQKKQHNEIENNIIENLENLYYFNEETDRQENNLSAELLTLDDLTRFAIFQHPIVSQDNYYNYHYKPVENSTLFFSIGLSDKVIKEKRNDGVVFEIFIDNKIERKKVFSNYLNPQENKQDSGWHDFQLDLSEYENQEIIIKFLTLPGPNNNYNYDWAYWGEPRIISNTN